MTFYYRNPDREQLSTALPDVEVLYLDADECAAANEQLRMLYDNPFTEGWYWQSCFPGCLPDSDPVGPFETDALALADARREYDC